MLNDIIKETYRDAYIEYFGHDIKKYKMYRILLFLTGFMLMGLVVLITKLWVLLLVGVLLGALMFKLPYINLTMLMSETRLKREVMFPQFLRTFIALITSQGNTYRALVATKDYMKDPLKSDLELLISQIEADNDLNYYIDFARKIGTHDAQMVMSMIYSFTKSGIVTEEMEELERTIDAMKLARMNDLVKRKASAQSSYSNYIIILVMLFVMGYIGTVIVTSLSQLSV